MKRLSVIFIALLAMLSLSACVHSWEGEDKNPDASNYPEGAIALTAENFTQYYNIEVETDCDYNYYEGETEVVSYVALVPRTEYREAVGEVRFTVDTEIYQTLNLSGSFKAVVGERTLRLDKGIVNAAYSGGRSAGRDEPYRVKEDTERITLGEVWGYVIPGEAAPNEYESLTRDQILASGEVLAEIRERVDGFRALYEAAESYHFYSGTKYELGSLFGEGKSVSGVRGGSKLSVDKKNRICADGRAIYYMHGDLPSEQFLNEAGLVTVGKSGYTQEELLAGALPSWALYDDAAIYVKYSDNLYYGYTTLSMMRESVWKDRLKAALGEYGVTSRYSEFVVRYEFGFDECSFNFEAAVDYFDPLYPVHYVDIHAATSQKISDADNVTLELFSPDEYCFLLPHDRETAAAYRPGMIEIDGETEDFTVKVYSNQYEGYNNTVVSSWLAVNIAESGVYSISPDEFIEIYNENFTKGYKSGDYFEAGIYFIELQSILYGLRERSFKVESQAYRDYGDPTKPETVTGDTLSFTLEGNGDRVAYAFTPTEDGLYDFGECENIALSAYRAGALDECVDDAWPPSLCLKLSGGVEYVLLFECVNYGGESKPVVHECTVRNLGTPPDGAIPLGEEWREVFLWGEDDPSFAVEIALPGIYYVEFDCTSGQEVDYGAFYTNDGKSVKPYAESAVINGRKVQLQALAPGEYIYKPSVYSNRYFRGQARLVLHTAGVSESAVITVPTDGYLTVTTSHLPTHYSQSVFTFTVEDDATLLIAEGSDSFTVYDESGAQIGITVYPPYVDGEVVCHRVARVLERGTYTIVFMIDEYSEPGVKEARIRLLPEEER